MNKDYFGIAERVIREKTNSRFSKGRQNHLTRSDFSIISNNCWAGTVYRYFGLPYQSPTAGLYFFGTEYVKFAGDLRHYLNTPIEFIDSCDSAHYETLKSRNELSKPVGIIDDVEIVFLHYPTPEEARAKWERRVERVNWDNLFIKFSQMNDCREEDLRAFDSLEHTNKICFTAMRRPDIACSVYHPRLCSGGGITNDTDRFTQGFNLVDWLNSEPAKYC